MAFYLKPESASPKTHGRHFSCRSKNAYRPLRVKDPGLRFYSATLARWINRDPIRERGGFNLYGFVKNDPVSHLDRLGQDGINTPAVLGSAVFSGTLVAGSVEGTLVDPMYAAASGEVSVTFIGALQTSDSAPLIPSGLNSGWDKMNENVAPGTKCKYTIQCSAHCSYCAYGKALTKTIHWKSIDLFGKVNSDILSPKTLSEGSVYANAKCIPDDDNFMKTATTKCKAEVNGKCQKSCVTIDWTLGKL